MTVSTALRPAKYLHAFHPARIRVPVISAVDSPSITVPLPCAVDDRSKDDAARSAAAQDLEMSAPRATMARSNPQGHLHELGSVRHPARPVKGGKMFPGHSRHRQNPKIKVKRCAGATYPGARAGSR